MTVRPDLLAQLDRLLRERTGQSLSGDRAYRIESALLPLARRWGVADINALVDRCFVTGDDGLAEEIVEALINNETSFFRDSALFVLIDDRILPSLMAARAGVRRLAIWSAGVSTGQEAYSLAMMIAGRTDMDGWRIDIVGTDISASAIARARAATYSRFEIQRGLGSRQILDHATMVGDSYRLTPGIRSRVSFLRQNILDAAPAGQFDLILCRNLLLYFDQERRGEVFRRLAGSIAPHGALVLGASETVLGQTELFQPDQAMRGVYRLKRAAPVVVSVPAGAASA